MRLKIIALALTLFIFGASQAQAAVSTLTDDMQVAREYWGWPRSIYCTEEIYVEAGIFWGGEAESTRDALKPERCDIRIITIGQLEERIANLQPGTPGFVPNSSEYAPRARELRCRIAVHEYGHWLGLNHSKDITNPMYPTVTFTPIIPGCEARMHEKLAPTRRKHHRRHLTRHSGSKVGRS